MTEKNSLALLQQDFKLFLQALWHELHLPPPTRAQYAIADYLHSLMTPKERL
jgi:hypothetical protein